MVGYDRFEGKKAWESLGQLYKVFRKYINYFQPSLNLVKKERDGAKVFKKYDTAKTSYQRVLLSKHISQADKDKLTREYEELDPVNILAHLEVLQDQLWVFSWNINGRSEVKVEINTEVVVAHETVNLEENSRINRYYGTYTKADFRKSLRTWRTRKDPFDNVWDEIQLRLELMPETTGKSIIEWLMVKYPNQFTLAQTRTLQRRVRDWRLTQQSLEERLRALLLDGKASLPSNSYEISP